MFDLETKTDMFMTRQNKTWKFQNESTATMNTV